MPRLYKVLMFGARDWDKMFIIERELKQIVAKYGKKYLLIITGGAPGADTLSEVAAHNYDVHCARIDALWDTRYRGAGPQRNEIMALLQPDQGVGFHSNIKQSKGTKDMARRLDIYQIPYKIVRR